MSNLFTQQQHSFQSKENTGRIGFFGPNQPAEQESTPDGSKPMGGKSEGGMDFGYGNKAGNISLGRFNSLSSNQNIELGAEQHDDSQLTPAPSFGKITYDGGHEDASASPTLNSKSVSKAASDHTRGGNYRKQYNGRNSCSMSGSGVSGGDKGWSEQKPHYMMND